MTNTLNIFLEGLSAERGLSQNTLQAYQRDLLDFLDFLKKDTFFPVTPSHIRSYLQHLNERALEPRTIARRLSALRHLYQFLYEQKEIPEDPTCDIEMPKIGKALPKVLSEEEVVALVGAAYDKDGPEGIRLLCLLELLYATGLRVSELVALPCSDIISALRQDQIPMPLVVRGKGNKERLVLLSAPAVKALKAYLEIRHLFDTERKALGKWLFPSSAKQGYLTRQRFGQLLKELALEANIPLDKVSPHIIRHAFASHMLNNGADLLSLQKLLGHSDIATTEIYTHVMGDRLEKTLVKHHPLSDL
ncbi:MAG TPA: recombinase XerD [Holosporales bacterium]|nr:recombinase XerD [Holosporales bacterium]